MSASAAAEVEFLWKEYFRDPPKWRGNGSLKTKQQFLDLKHTKEAVWIHQDEQNAKLLSELEDAVFCVWTKKKLNKGQEVEEEEEEKEEEVLTVSNEFQEGTATPVTLVALLQACAREKDMYSGGKIHADIVHRGLLENNVFLGSSLVNMYAKCGALAKAQEVFDELPVRNVVSWTALIAGYVQHGQGKEAIICFDRMQPEGMSPNAITLSSILKACGIVGASDKGREIHAEIARQGLLGKDIVLGTALVDMYIKCGALAKAQEVFDALPVQNAVSWTALITGYAQEGHGQEAIDCFEHMQRWGLSPDAFTFACILKACGNIGAENKGQEIHAEIVGHGLLDKDNVLGNALVDMYAKCGALVKAQEVFEELPIQDLVSWNALIAGYAQLGKDANVVNLFDRMLEEGNEPDLVTFTVLLNSCSHAGLLDRAQMYFETMSTCYDIVPTRLHYTCMVDLFARAGHLDKALAVIKQMPFSASLMVWHIVLAACRRWGNVKMGRLAFEHAVQVDEKDAAVYVSVSNIYASAGMQGEVNKIEAMRVKNQAWKMEEAWTLWVD